MASVKGFSVAGTHGRDMATAANRSTVYSYSSGLPFQDGSTLSAPGTAEPNGAAGEDAFRTGWQPAYTKGGVAAPGDAITPTLLGWPQDLTDGDVTGVTLTTAGTGNDAFVSDEFICSTTNLDADMTGGGLILRVTTNASGVPTAVAVEVAGQGYVAGSVGIDGFPGSDVTVAVS